MNPEDIMLSEISPDTEILKKKAWSHLYVKPNDIKYGETENEMVVSRRVEVGETGDVSQRVQSCKMTKSGDLVYSMMAAVNNTGLNTGNLLRG